MKIIKIFGYNIKYTPNASIIFTYNLFALLKNVDGNYYYASFKSYYFLMAANHEKAYKYVFLDLYLNKNIY